MVSLAAALSDGVITNWLAPSDVPAVRAVAGPDRELIARVFVCPTADASLARHIGRRMIAAYLTVPAYAAFHDWLGRGPRFGPMREAWAAGERKAALAAIDDELVDELVVHGLPATAGSGWPSTRRPGWTPRSSRSCPRPARMKAEAVRQLAPARIRAGAVAAGPARDLTAAAQTPPGLPDAWQFLPVPGPDQPVRDGHRRRQQDLPGRQRAPGPPATRALGDLVLVHAQVKPPRPRRGSRASGSAASATAGRRQPAPGSRRSRPPRPTVTACSADSPADEARQDGHCGARPPPVPGQQALVVRIRTQHDHRRIDPRKRSLPSAGSAAVPGGDVTVTVPQRGQRAWLSSPVWPAPQRARTSLRHGR